METDRRKKIAQFHQYQGERIIRIFVIPSAVMTLFNIAAALFPVKYVNRKWLWLSLLAYAFDWIFSFTMQIPIQLILETKKDMALIEELLRTNWWRFGADTMQFLFVCVLIWEILKKASLAEEIIQNKGLLFHAKNAKRQVRNADNY